VYIVFQYKEQKNAYLLVNLVVVLPKEKNLCCLRVHRCAFVQLYVRYTIHQKDPLFFLPKLIRVLVLAGIELIFSPVAAMFWIWY